MCRVRVCVCARMAALLIFVGWFVMVCVLLVFHFCLFHISVVRMILCQGYLRANVLERTLALPMVASTLINGVGFAACVKKTKNWMNTIFFQSRYLALFVYKFKYTWSVLVEIKQNKHSMHSLGSEWVQSGSTWKFLKSSTSSHRVHAAGMVVTLVLLWVSLHVFVGSLWVWGGDKGRVETLQWPSLLLWTHACQRSKSETFQCFNFHENEAALVVLDFGIN